MPYGNIFCLLCHSSSLGCFIRYDELVSLCFFRDRKQLRKTSFFSDLFSSENCGLVSRYMVQKQSRRLPNNSMFSLEKSVLPDLSGSEMLHNKFGVFF